MFLEKPIMRLKAFHRSFCYLALGLSFFACATRSKQSRKSSTETNVGNTTTIVRDKINPKSIEQPQFAILEMNICKSDKGVFLDAKPPNDEKVDYFEFKNCLKDDPNHCTQGAFVDQSPLIGPEAQKPETHQISIRSCIDENHSTDQGELCSQWSEAKNYDFPVSSQSTLTLVKQQNNTRELMTTLCLELQKEMNGYLLEVKDSKGVLKTLVQQHLAYIGINGCRDLLLSKVLKVSEELNQLFPQDTAKDNPTNSTSTNTTATQAQIIVQNQNRNLIEGAVFLALGGTGTIISLVHMVNAWKKTLTENGQILANEILELEKKQKAIQAATLESDIKDLGMKQDVLKLLERFELISDADLDGNLAAKKELIRGLDGATPIQSILDTVTQGAKNPDATDINSRIRQKFAIILLLGTSKHELQQTAAFIDSLTKSPPASPEDFWKRVQDLFTDLNARSPVARTGWSAWLPGAGEVYSPPPKVSELPPQSPGKESSIPAHQLFEELYYLYEARDLILKHGTPVAAGAGVGAARPPHLLAIDALQGSMDQKAKALKKVKQSWADYMKQLSAAGATGAVKGGAIGAALGGGTAGLAEYLISPFGISPLKAQAAAAGGGVGAIVGAGQALWEKHKELQGATWTPEQREILDGKRAKTLAEAQKARDQLLRDINDLHTIKQGDFRAENGKRSFGIKVKAAAPWLVAASISSVTAALGARELSLADDSPENRFLSKYRTIYKQAKVLQEKYTGTLTQLLSGDCQ